MVGHLISTKVFQQWNFDPKMEHYVLICKLHFTGKPYFTRIEDHIAEESSGYGDGLTLPMSSPARSSPQSQSSEVTERFSRKVFVGGLPPDIDEGTKLTRTFHSPKTTLINFD